MNTRYALVDEVAAELEALAAPKVSKPEPKTEADRARAWLAGLDLDNMQNNDVEKAEFYKYAIAITRGRDFFYLSTRSPQQKQSRFSYTTWARSNNDDGLNAGLERFISEMEDKIARRNAKTQAKRQARAAFVNPYKVGDFLNSSWGYDQTNKEFYQVLEVRDLSIKIREVAQNREHTGYDSGTCTPIANKFHGEALWVTIQVSESGYHWVNSPIHGHLYKWDGKPEYWSSYA